MTTCQHKVISAMYVFHNIDPFPGLPKVIYHVHFQQEGTVWKVQVMVFRDRTLVCISEYNTANDPDLKAALLFLTMHLEEQIPGQNTEL